MSLAIALRSFVFSLCVGFAFAEFNAQQSSWQPSPGHTQIPIWPAAPPDPQPIKGPETVEIDPKFLIAGKPVIGISDVSLPTMTVYPPEGKSTSVAVVVFPGGGYQELAIDLEGTEVFDWLTAKGITCILLKYRVTDVGPYPKSGPYPESPMALEDAQRTLGLVRFHAADWHIYPHNGVLGFSAGGHLVAAISTHYEKRLYPASMQQTVRAAAPTLLCQSIQDIYPSQRRNGTRNGASKRSQFPIRRTPTRN